MNELPDDEAARFLTDLEQQLRWELDGAASVERRVYDEGMVAVHIAPVRAGSLWVDWIDMTGDVVLSAGGGRWELDRASEDMAFLEDVVRSVVAGRATETFALRRSHVEVTLADGSVERSTEYNGCMTLVTPLPGWRRWGRRVKYVSYR